MFHAFFFCFAWKIVELYYMEQRDHFVYENTTIRWNLTYRFGVDGPLATSPLQFTPPSFVFLPSKPNHKS